MTRFTGLSFNAGPRRERRPTTYAQLPPYSLASAVTFRTHNCRAKSDTLRVSDRGGRVSRQDPTTDLFPLASINDNGRIIIRYSGDNNGRILREGGRRESVTNVSRLFFSRIILVKFDNLYITRCSITIYKYTYESTCIYIW